MTNMSSQTKTEEFSKMFKTSKRKLNKTENDRGKVFYNSFFFETS